MIIRFNMLKKVLSVLSIAVILYSITSCTPDCTQLKYIESSISVSNRIKEVQTDEELLESVKKVIKVDTIDEKARHLANLLLSKQVVVEVSTYLM